MSALVYLSRDLAVVVQSVSRLSPLRNTHVDGMPGGGAGELSLKKVKPNAPYTAYIFVCITETRFDLLSFPTNVSRI